jgi:hypothetical protein
VTATARVFGGRCDGRQVEEFPEGDWLAGANGWPLCLNEKAEPVCRQGISGARYVQKLDTTLDRSDLVYVWEPSLAAWLLTQEAR